MKTIANFLLLGLLTLTLTGAYAEGFTDSDVIFYGEVRQVGGAGATLLQSGTLELTLENQGDAENSVTLTTELRPTGAGDSKPFSYSLRVPLKFLPDANQKDAYLSIGSQLTDFQIKDIAIDGRSATLPDGSKEFYGLGFASRSSRYRLDLLVQGDSTDTDGDGLPDWWETRNGLDPNNPADATSDLDADGWSNLSEFRRGSDPNQSNTQPQLATAEISIPESGEAGLLVQVLDSDTADADIYVTLPDSVGAGFELKLDGAVLDSGDAQRFPLTDLQSGRLTIAHTDRTHGESSLPISWDDGGEPSSAQLLLRVARPSSTDGNDASLWLDGFDLPSAQDAAISNWSDRSGNGKHAMQPSAEHQPTVTGRSADFSSAATAHLFFQDLAVAGGNHSVLAAYRAAPTSNHAQTILASNRGHLKLDATTSAIPYPGAPFYQMDGLAVRGFENSSGATATSIFRREDDLLQNIFGLSYDGENVAAEVIDPVLPTLGARRPAIAASASPVTEAFGGQLHELLIFPSALPEQKLRDVHDYLQSKWSGAVIWDLSSELKAITLTASAGAQTQIIRGGHGNDDLGGGSGDDTISGGPGSDRMSGGAGSDQFVFGGVDTGSDHISDYDMANDIIDLSALFWGQTGDARSFIAVRLDTNFSTPIPTIDSVLLVQRPDGSVQEIVLEDRVVGATQLVQLIVEGRIRMGGLSIPTGVQLALAAGSSQEPLRESLDQPFSVEVTRDGAGTAAALDVPIGLFADALGRDLVIEGAADSGGQRAVVSFARGETTKLLTLRPVPDLETEGDETWQVAVLPHYRYTVGGTSVERTVGDAPLVWLEILQANAISETNQPARVRVLRDGDVSKPLVLDIILGGTAEEGVHISVPSSLEIPAGQEFAELQIAALADGLADGPRIAVLRLAPGDGYLLGNPHEAVLYAATSADTASGIGFDRWLQASTDGAITNLTDLVRIAPQEAGSFLRAYAFGLGSVEQLRAHHIDLNIVDGRPEITAPGSFAAADVRWGVQASGDLNEWADAGDSFVEVPSSSGLKLVGEPLPPGTQQKFYRINLMLDPGQLAGSSIAALTGATKFGISGDATWSAEPATGDLQSSGGSQGTSSRIIAEVSASTVIDFEMEIVAASEGTGGALAFYLDGIKVAETDGAAVTVQHQIDGSGAHLLMWEFTRGSGDAVIRRSQGGGGHRGDF